MYYNKVEICGVNTAKLERLSAEETEELLKRTKAGDKAARERLIQGNLRLVLSVIRDTAIEYSHNHFDNVKKELERVLFLYNSNIPHKA